MKSVAKDLWILSKPGLTRLVVLTALCGAALAPSSMSLVAWLSLLAGSLGIVGSANILNCYLERDVDALMERTRHRPLATGKMAPKVALSWGLTIAFASIVILGLGTNELTAFLGLLGFVLYVTVYTPLKRLSMTALFVGAVPGAIPPLMGWAAARGRLEEGAWILFAILFLWQLPHFIAISLNRQREYDRAGLKTVPSSLGREWAECHMFAYSGFLVLASLLPCLMGWAGRTYALATGLMGLLFVGLCIVAFLQLVRVNWNRFVFFGSLLYLPLVLGFWVVDQWIGQWMHQLAR
jgi:protoheme IX farnesyltransferase